jgi:tRNA 2-selenouridine synthase
MALQLSIGEFLNKMEKLPVVDVRSPSEFLKGHIPGAFNIPLFSDKERAVIGKEYKKNSRDNAVLKGLEYARPKMVEMVNKAREIAPGSPLLLHCWRGGMRSENVALLFRASGIRCDILEGGYQSYRRYLRKSFSTPAKFIILGGLTGCGKTEILTQLHSLGQQTIDLEGIAHHKGSAFGALGQKTQPTNEQFENNFFYHWRTLDPALPVWLEDESMAIGSILVPEEIFTRMRNSVVVKIEMDLDLRVKRLNREYATFPPGILKDSIRKIRKRLGDQNTRIAFTAIDQSQFSKAIELSLAYYDKAYSYGLNRRDAQNIYSIHLNRDNPVENAEVILRFAKRSNLI